MKGKVAGMGIDGTSLYGYDYDTYGRLNKITTAAGDFNYTRLANSDLVNQMTRPNNVTTSWSYEPHRDLITQVANGAVSVFDYVNNAIGNRTNMSRSGSAFAASDTINYTYNNRNEVVGALSDALDTDYNFSYAYDPIGNRLTSTQEGEQYAYTTNNLNQYTQINAEEPTYDADGNMLTRDGWTQVWNGANRMIVTYKDNQRLEFDYDYMGRRIFKKVYDGDTLTTHTRFVYDGYKLIQELDALNDNALLRQYVWQPNAVGLDVPLSVFDAAANQTYYYNTDANKNISDLTATDGSVAAHYEYTPFGSQTAATESYVANPFRFSSEYHDQETNLIYYNFRFYTPSLGYWINQDPIMELGEANLYGFVSNNSIKNYDYLGLEGDTTHGTVKCKENDSCSTLLVKLQQWKDHYNGRHDELIKDKLNLKTCNPDKYNNHIDKLEEAGRNVAKCARFLSEKIATGCCEDDTTVPTIDLAPVPERIPKVDLKDTLVYGGAAVGIGYIAYRVLRLLPSFFPPLWLTIPANLCIP